MKVSVGVFNQKQVLEIKFVWKCNIITLTTLRTTGGSQVFPRILCIQYMLNVCHLKLCFSFSWLKSVRTYFLLITNKLNSLHVHNQKRQLSSQRVILDRFHHQSFTPFQPDTRIQKIFRNFTKLTKFLHCFDLYKNSGQ